MLIVITTVETGSVLDKSLEAQCEAFAVIQPFELNPRLNWENRREESEPQAVTKAQC